MTSGVVTMVLGLRLLFRLLVGGPGPQDLYVKSQGSGTQDLSGLLLTGKFKHPRSRLGFGKCFEMFPQTTLTGYLQAERACKSLPSPWQELDTINASPLWSSPSYLTARCRLTSYTPLKPRLGPHGISSSSDTRAPGYPGLGTVSTGTPYRHMIGRVDRSKNEDRPALETLILQQS